MKPFLVIGVCLCCLLLQAGEAPLDEIGLVAQQHEIKLLIQELSEKDPTKRANAALKLGAFESAAAPAVPFLVTYIKDDREAGGLVVARSAGYVVTIGNYSVGQIVVRALGRIRDKGAVAPLIEAIGNRGNQSLWKKRKDAAWSLGLIGDPAAIPALLQIISDEKDILRNHVSDGLGLLGLPAVDALLGHYLGGNEALSKRAEEALCVAGQPVVKVVAPLLKHRSPELKRRGAHLLAQLCHGSSRLFNLAGYLERELTPAENAFVNSRHAALIHELVDAVQPLVAALTDADVEVRRNTAAGVASLTNTCEKRKDYKDPAQVSAAQNLEDTLRRLAIEPVALLLNDPDNQIRNSAETAMRYLSPERVPPRQPKVAVEKPAVANALPEKAPATKQEAASVASDPISQRTAAVAKQKEAFRRIEESYNQSKSRQDQLRQEWEIKRYKPELLDDLNRRIKAANTELAEQAAILAKAKQELRTEEEALYKLRQNAGRKAND